MNLSQKLYGFAKTFRSALLTRWQGFCDSDTVDRAIQQNKAAFFMILSKSVSPSVRNVRQSVTPVEIFTLFQQMSDVTFLRLPFFRMRVGWGGAESQKPCQRVSNADRKVFANPESFWEKFIIGWRNSGYFAIQNIQIICKVSGWTGKFPGNLKIVLII